MMEKHLEDLANRYGFEFGMVNMEEMEQRLDAGDKSLLQVFSEQELAYFKDLKLYKNRIQWLAGRYAVKSALFKYKLAGQSLMDVSCIDVLKGQDSAPYLLQYPAINCSISHSFPWCIGVVSEKKIGIDIEKVFVPEDSLIRFFYSDREKEALANCREPKEYAKRAMVFWTRKEAVSKLLRLGMKMDFKALNTTEDRVCLHNEDITLTSLNAFLNNDDFCISLAFSSSLA